MGTKENSDGHERKRPQIPILELKKEKAKVKSLFTQANNRLAMLTEDEEIDKPAIRNAQSEFDYRQEIAMAVIDKLCLAYRENGEMNSEFNTIEEMETLELEHMSTHAKVLDSLNILTIISRESDTEEAGAGSKVNVGTDMWRQLKIVEIPIFACDKKKYRAWKSAFMAYIDSAPATGEYKRLQLRQYTSGDALRTIDNLGHSKASYEATKERLERKFGGSRRQVAIYLEELDNFRVMKYEAALLIEKFADLLDVAVLNMKEANRADDLGDGSLYLRLYKKMPVAMLARYHRWIAKNHATESVEILKDWLNQEAVYHTIAHETISGLNSKLVRLLAQNKQVENRVIQLSTVTNGTILVVVAFVKKIMEFGAARNSALYVLMKDGTRLSS